MNTKGLLPERLRAAGLTPVSSTRLEDGPSVSRTWQLVAASTTIPDVIVPYSEGAESVTEPWEIAIGHSGVLSADRALLIAPTLVNQGERLEWIAVRLTDSVDLTALTDARGDLEFVSRSLDGKSYCGVTTEEDGYWIATGVYPVVQQQSWISMTEWPPTETATIADILATFRSDENIPQLKIALTKVLHEVYGCTISAARELVAHLDESLAPTIPPTALEAIWSRIRHHHATG
ncbi:hypothetical protein NN3_04420 [Nocardia neocaledoniensis NBRC 108232]|uniref:hypothetical protein n=1 Tax=Nocardia neocaledoniensis TaxID=236511 RepID=UPI00119527EF|nr:hypothetical protein [Nocardia neocaledoniensis]GEM29435.1 hypothetical protein NN3_04420 [Nocardia neocaledoniensis NBRC 108232]